MIAKTLMIQGTSSSVGKSLMVAAFCRIYARRGIRVAPFKAQNMSNNAAVCPDGAEIGRAQALQAAAAGIGPTADMNPVLLKPEADSLSQVIVRGRPWKTLAARNYYQSRKELWPIVTESLDHLRTQYELIIIEGAGSPAELNFRGTEIVNMAIALHAASPVLLIGDIERGGVFAQLLGTLWLLAPEERALVRGLIVNKFQGDLSLFDDGVRILEEKGEVPVLGVIPYLRGLLLPEEDSAVLDAPVHSQRKPDATDIDIVVIRLPRIANFDDFDPLLAEPQVNVRFVESLVSLGQPDAIIIPGTKSTVSDLDWMRQTGLAEKICQLAAVGIPVVGICGGYQMLGQSIRDPDQIESTMTEVPGLGLLATQTIFERSKATYLVRAEASGDLPWLGPDSRHLTGYEIHMGRTSGTTPWLNIHERNGQTASVEDGAFAENGRIFGCYLHGLFNNDGFRHSWLSSLRAGSLRHESSMTVEQSKSTPSLDESLDRLADAVEAAIDMKQLDHIVWGDKGSPS